MMIAMIVCASEKVSIKFTRKGRIVRDMKLGVSSSQVFLVVICTFGVSGGNWAKDEKNLFEV